MDKSISKIRNRGIFIIILILVASWFLLISPRMSEPEEIQAKIDASKQTSISFEQKLQLLKQQEASLSEAEKLADTIGIKFPAQTNVNDLTTQIEDAAERAGLSSDNLIITLGNAVAVEDSGSQSGQTIEGGSSPEGQEGSETSGEDTVPVPAPATETQPKYAKLDLEISADGSYGRLTAFISELQKTERVIIMTSVLLSTQPAAEEAPQTQTLADGTVVQVPSQTASQEAQYTLKISAYTILLPELLKVQGGTNAAESTVPAENPELPPLDPETITEELPPTDSELIEPNTGQPIDPNTGQPIDPNTGQPIEPNTGQPIDPAEPAIQ